MLYRRAQVGHVRAFLAPPRIGRHGEGEVNQRIPAVQGLGVHCGQTGAVGQHGRRVDAATKAAAAARHVVHLDPREAATRGSIREHVSSDPAQHRRHPVRIACEPIRVVRHRVVNADRAWRIRVAGQSDGCTRNAHADADFGTQANTVEQSRHGVARPDIAVVVAVPANGAPKQAFADRDGPKSRGCADVPVPGPARHKGQCGPGGTSSVHG